MLTGMSGRDEEPEEYISIVAESDDSSAEQDSSFINFLLNTNRRRRRNALAHIMDEDNADFESDGDELPGDDDDNADEEEDMLSIASRSTSTIAPTVHHDQRITSEDDNSIRSNSQQPTSSKHKSTPPRDPTPKKVQRDSMDSQNDSDSCPICFENWCNSGKHQLVSLKCGHLFGRVCIERWIKDAKRCPQCNMKARKMDVRVIYAKSVRLKDTTELTEATNLYETEKNLRKKKEMELAKTQMQYQMAMAEVNSLKSQIEDLKNHQVVSSLPQLVQDKISSPAHSSSTLRKFSLMKSVTVSAGSCRVMDFHEQSLSLAISQGCPHSTFMTGYGLRKFSVADMKSTQFTLLHSGPIRDVKFSPHASLVLTASQDKTLTITNWEANSLVHAYKPQRPVWCCCWDSIDSNLLYCGLNNGCIHCYDLRNTSDVLHTITNPDSRCPVVSMYSIPRRVDPQVPGGLLVQTLDGVTYWQQKAGLSNSEYEPHILPLPGGSCTDLQYSSSLAQCLVSYRPGANYRCTTHILCQLKFVEESIGVSCDVIEKYQEGNAHKLLTKNAIMATASSDNLICVGAQAKSSVRVYEAKAKGNLLQALDCGSAPLDIHPLHVNDSYFLSTLTEKELKIYDLK